MKSNRVILYILFLIPSLCFSQEFSKKDRSDILSEESLNRLADLVEAQQKVINDLVVEELEKNRNAKSLNDKILDDLFKPNATSTIKNKYKAKEIEGFALENNISLKGTKNKDEMVERLLKWKANTE